MNGFLLPNAASIDDARAPIYFLHIQKTVGLKLNSYLLDIYNDFEICGLFPGWYELLSMPVDEIEKRKLINGHFGAYLHRHYPAPLRYFTFLRDPIERALSHYGHVVKNKNHYYHKLAQEIGGISKYLRDPRTRPTISNFQIRNLGADFDPVEVSIGLTKEQFDQRELERLLDTMEMGQPSGVLLSIAKARLDQMCFVGITEKSSESLRLLCESFGWPFPQQFENRNTNPGRIDIKDLSTSDRKLLYKLNQEDIDLYEYAKARFSVDWERSKFVYPKIHAFVSYAQNQEDVLLHRVFSGIEAGTYVDVGANDPSGDSVTRALYERGWHGINIEPVPSLFQSLQARRPRDINLQCAAGAISGELEFFEIPGTGLSTLQADIASRHEAMGFAVKRTIVLVDTLTNIISNSNIHDIKFLKIDAEGFEKKVLEGLDFNRFRPWVVLVEATEPNTNIPSFSNWEYLITSNEYSFVFFDGLNRYYVAKEREEFVGLFDAPVSVVDNYIKYSEVIADSAARDSMWKLRKLSAWWNMEQARLNELLEVERRALDIERNEAQKLANQNPKICELLRAVSVPGSTVLNEELNSAWYRERNPDVVKAGVDPYEHWISSGASEGRQPALNAVELIEKLMCEQRQTLEVPIDVKERELKQTLLEAHEQFCAQLERGLASAEKIAQLQQTAGHELAAQRDAYQEQFAAMAEQYSQREQSLRAAIEEKESELRQILHASQERQKDFDGHVMQLQQTAGHELAAQREAYQEQFAAMAEQHVMNVRALQIINENQLLQLNNLNEALVAAQLRHTNALGQARMLNEALSTELTGIKSRWFVRIFMPKDT